MSGNNNKHTLHFKQNRKEITGHEAAVSTKVKINVCTDRYFCLYLQIRRCLFSDDMMFPPTSWPMEHENPPPLTNEQLRTSAFVYSLTQTQADSSVHAFPEGVWESGKRGWRGWRWWLWGGFSTTQEEPGAQSGLGDSAPFSNTKHWVRKINHSGGLFSQLTVFFQSGWGVSSSSQPKKNMQYACSWSSTGTTTKSPTTRRSVEPKLCVSQAASSSQNSPSNGHFPALYDVSLSTPGVQGCAVKIKKPQTRPLLQHPDCPGEK